MALCANPIVAVINGPSYNLLVWQNVPPAGCSNYVVLSQIEFTNLQDSASNNILQLSAADGALIAGSILALWAVGYAFRVLIKFLKSH